MGRISEKNRTLLSKSWWEFGVEREAMCRIVVMQKKRGRAGGWVPGTFNEVLIQSMEGV